MPGAVFFAFSLWMNTLYIMSHSFQALLDENFKLKSQLHMYEQYQALLRIQRNLAVSLGKTVTLPKAFDMILETVSHTQGVEGAGVLLLDHKTGHYNLVAHTGIPRTCISQIREVMPDDAVFPFLGNKGQYSCCECGLDKQDGCFDNDSSSLGIFPVMRGNAAHAVLLVFCADSFDKLSIGAELLEAISNQVDGVIERVEKEEELRASLKEKEVLLKEVHHRVKNNLAMISSFISLQKSTVSDENALTILDSLQQKMQSVVGIYNLLYRTENLHSIQFDEYCLRLIDDMISTLADDPDSIEFEHHCDKLELSINQSITIGLILSELTTNSLKYAFPAGRGGIRLESSICGDNAVIQYSDSGKMFPQDFDIRESTGLGERIVLELVMQLGGTLDFDGESSIFTITFPLDPEVYPPESA